MARPLGSETTRWRSKLSRRGKSACGTLFEALTFYIHTLLWASRQTYASRTGPGKRWRSVYSRRAEPSRAELCFSHCLFGLLVLTFRAALLRSYRDVRSVHERTRSSCAMREKFADYSRGLWAPLLLAFANNACIALSQSSSINLLSRTFTSHFLFSFFLSLFLSLSLKALACAFTPWRVAWKITFRYGVEYKILREFHCLRFRNWIVFSPSS